MEEVVQHGLQFRYIERHGRLRGRTNRSKFILRWASLTAHTPKVGAYAATAALQIEKPTYSLVITSSRLRIRPVMAV
jgi:hypothetical protein